MSFTVLKIDVTKIDKTQLYVGAKGTYLECILSDPTPEPNEYGNHGYVRQGLDKEARDRGEKGPFIGNYKIIGGAKRTQPKQDTQTQRTYKLATKASDDPQDDIPF